jgi:hypothetical protein
MYVLVSTGLIRLPEAPYLSICGLKNLLFPNSHFPQVLPTFARPFRTLLQVEAGNKNVRTGASKL